MNKKTTIAWKKAKMISYKDMVQIFSGILLGMCIDQRILPLLIVYSFIVYEKGWKTYVCFAILTTISALYVGMNTVIVYACIFAFIFLYKKLEEWMRLPVYFNGIQLFLCLASTYYLYGISFQMFHLSIIVFALHLVCIQDDNVKKLPLFIYLTLGYVWALVFLSEYVMYIELTYLALCAYYLPSHMYIIIGIYFMILGLNPLYIGYLMCICVFSKKMVPSMMVWFLLLYENNIYSIYFCLVCTILGMFAYNNEDRFMKKSIAIEKEHQLHLEHSFSHQIVQFANVFYNLSYYYETYGDGFSEMLKRMGEALEYNAKLSKQYVYKQSKLQTRIKEMLLGYHFLLLKCDVENDKEKLWIQLELENLYEHEVEEVIVPLLEKLCECSLRVHILKPFLLQKGKYKIVLESENYANITMYGESVHVHEVSGDSFQSFQKDPYVILLLSDGMGQGLKAKKASSITLQIMESMMRCNIPQLECIKMMNLFMRSDVYATLDVLSFDRRNRKAYLSKAASAPTYLYRDGNLFEMSAHSLPIGIVDYVSAEVFEITYKKGDIFIMCSDGVEKEEIEKWMNLRRCSAIKNEGLNLMQFIKAKKRKDDATILMAKID